MPQDIDVSEITTDSAKLSSDKWYETEGNSIDPNVNSLFITSPADIYVHK